MRRIATTIAMTMLLAPAAAEAHVEITPKRAPAGSDARLTLEVENERPTSSTRKVDVQIPSGISSVEGRALRGWRLGLRPSSGQPRRITLTAPQGRELSGDEHARFRFVMGLPERAGTVTLKVLQTYDNGEIVRWIGPPGSSVPAPTLRLTAPKAAPPEEPTPTETQPAPESTPAEDSPDSEDGGSSDTGPILAGIGGVLLVGAAAAFFVRRRRG